MEDTRKAAGWLPAGALLWLVALWVWVIPSAWFWGLAESQGILLPHIPHYLWAGPGELWIGSPWLFAGVCLALSGGIVAAARRWPGLTRGTRVLALVVVIASIAIHSLWGGAILSQ